MKVKLNSFLPAWLDIWYEIDALVSLSNFAYLNPEYHFPHILSTTDQSSEPVFQAGNLGHPLIHSQSKVTNRSPVDQSGKIMLITGSNMSGKSTFLRTLGINLVLAFAGAPVNASQMKPAILRLFSCIQVSDSTGGWFLIFLCRSQAF